MPIDRMREQIVSPVFMRRVFTSSERHGAESRPDAADYYAKVSVQARK
ncbi:MAG: hypothetical protein M1274_15270 [Actinobacteria bacterium]|nr:hypothetical protein [Actinomycetota bacterium]